MAPDAAQPLGGVDLRLPARGRAQVGLREGARQRAGGQTLADRLVDAEFQRRHRPVERWRRIAFIDVGIEEPRQKLILAVRHETQRPRRAQGQRRGLPVAGAGQAVDPGGIGGRDRRRRGQRLAGIVLGAGEQADIEGAAEDLGRLRQADAGQHCRRLIQRADVEKLVDPGQEQQPAGVGIEGRIDLGQQDLHELPLQRRHHVARFVADQPRQIAGRRRSPQFARQAGDRDRQQAGGVGRDLAQRRHLHLAGAGTGGGLRFGRIAGFLRRQADRGGLLDAFRQPVDRRLRILGRRRQGKPRRQQGHDRSRRKPCHHRTPLPVSPASMSPVPRPHADAVPCRRERHSPSMPPAPAPADRKEP